MSETSHQSKGRLKVKQHYADYGRRARELKEEGRGVIGFICAFVPVEIIAAAGFFPFRLKGDVNEPVTKGDVHLESISCPFVRSLFDLSVKGAYDFCDGLVVPHACDSITTPYKVWKYIFNRPYNHFINLPRKASGPSIPFFRAELETFKKSLEKHTGRQITDQALSDAVSLYNQNRTLIKDLYDLRKSDPPGVSGTMITETLVAAMSLPVEESNQLLTQVIRELKADMPRAIKKSPRLMIAGPTIDNSDIIRLIEDCGANVVSDSVCIGTRDFFPLTDVTDDPMDGITDRYLVKINCPRTYRDQVGSTFSDDLNARFGDMGALIKSFQVDGVILYSYRYCDPFGFEIPARKAYLESLRIPVLYLEDNYFTGTIGRLKTRIQAFLEMIS